MKCQTVPVILVLLLVVSIVTGLISHDYTFGNAEAADSTATDWPMFGYNPAHTGSPDNIAPITHDLLWKFDTGAGCDWIISSSPVVVNGIVYIGSDDGAFHAVNSSSGTPLWSQKVGDFTAMTPAVVNGVVYASTWEGHDCALNASTGAVIWNSTRTYSASSPAVANGLHYIFSGNGSVIARNASTGNTVWICENISLGGESSPVVVDNTLYVTSSGGVSAIDASTGELKWGGYIGLGSTYNSPAAANGIVYAICQGDGLCALNATTGAQIWNHSIGPSDACMPSVAEGIAYAVSFTNGVYALNATTGALVWNSPLKVWCSSLAVTGGLVYAGNSDGIYALSASTGEEQWSYPPSNININSCPVVANGVLFVKSGDGYLYAFGKASHPSISIQPKFGFAGTQATVSGSGFASDSTVTVTFGGTSITLSSSAVDSLGHIAGAFMVPALTSGHYQISVTDSLGNVASDNYLIVTPTAITWPMYMYDPQHSGSPDNTAAVDNSLLWKFSVDRGNMIIRVASSAAVVGGIVYDASQNSYVYALDAYTGTCYWRFNLGGLGTLSSPAVVDDVVYIGGDYGIYAINAHSGTQIWNNPAPRAVVTAPAVSNGVVYVGSFFDGVFALRASDGQQIWRYSEIGEVLTSPTVYGSLVYIGSEDGNIYAFNTATGTLVWKYNCTETYPLTVSLLPLW
jgi:outer membrane protein assembly factor BamB